MTEPAPTLSAAGDVPPEGRVHSHRVRPRQNALAVAAFILALLLSPLAVVFGHIAVAQISRADGAERGSGLAWTAVALGYLWTAGALIVGALLYQAFTAPLGP